jgi:four helix bundle protein
MPTTHASRGFRQLLAWQRAKELAAEILRITDTLPPRRQFTIGAQMERAALSVVSNIAEGHVRGSRARCLYHLTIARGSLNELDAQLEVAIDAGVLSADRGARAIDLARQAGSLLTLLYRSLDRR